MVVFYQHHGMHVSQWQALRQDLGPHMTCRVVKASQARRMWGHSHLFRGPCCIIGLHDLTYLPSMRHVVAAYGSQLVELGAHYHGDFWTTAMVHRVCTLPDMHTLHTHLWSTLHGVLHTCVSHMDMPGVQYVRHMTHTHHMLCDLLRHRSGNFV